MQALGWLTIGFVVLAGCSKPTGTTKSETAGKPSAARPVVTAPGESLKHLPAGCAVAGSFDWKQLANAPQLTAHRKETQQAVAKHAGPRVPMLSRLFEQMGVSAQEGVERGAFCLGELPAGHAGPARNAPFVVALSGPFQQKGPLDAMQQLATPGTFRERQVGGLRALQRGARLFVQTKDQVLLISNDEPLLQAALVESDAHKSYDLPRGPAISLVASEAAVRTLAPEGESAKAHPIQVELAKAKRLEAKLSLVPGELAVTLSMTSDKDALASSSRLERVLSPLMEDGPHLTQLKQRVPGDLLTALKSIRFKTEASKVVATAPLSEAALGELLHGFGALSALSQASAQAPEPAAPAGGSVP